MSLKTAIMEYLEKTNWYIRTRILQGPSDISISEQFTNGMNTRPTYVKSISVYVNKIRYTFLGGIFLTFESFEKLIL